MRLTSILSILILSVFAGLALAASNSQPLSFAHKTLTLNGEAVHDIGRVGLNVTNFGLIGSQPGSTAPYSEAPSLEYPLGSGVQNLWGAGIWVGGMVDGVPHVSTGQYEKEFLADPEDPADTIYESHEGAKDGSRLRGTADDDHDRQINEDPLNGFDDDGDGKVDEDYAAIGQQYFHAQMRDDRPEVEAVYPDHRPMGLLLSQESFGWSDPRVDDLIGFKVTVDNVGEQTIEGAFVGLFADFDIGMTPGSTGSASDDLVGYADYTADSDLSEQPVHVTMGYAYDAHLAGPYAGVVLLSHEGPNGSLFGAQGVQSFSGELLFGRGGDPTNDAERYAVLSKSSFDVPVRPLSNDYRLLLSAGPFGTLKPGDHVTFQFAFVMGDDLQSLRANAANAVALARGTRIRGQIVPWSLPKGPAHRGHEVQHGHGTLADSSQHSRSAKVWPNPFNPSVDVQFSLERAGAARVQVFDAKGRVVRVLANEDLPAGDYQRSWNGTDESGRPAASGIYFFRITTPEGSQTVRAVLVR